MKKFVLKKVRLFFWMILLTGFVVGIIGSILEKTALFAIGIFVMLASMIFYVIFYRCPYCERFLGRNTGDYCPFCGKKLNK